MAYTNNTLIRRVVFEKNDGSGLKQTWECEKDKPIGALPNPHRDGYVLIGWFTEPEMGEGAKFTSKYNVERDLVLYAHWRKAKTKKWMHQFNNAKDTWDNDTKNQTSLDLGSDEYEEYVENLKEHNPFRPDDEMHKNLAEYNVQYAEKLAEKAAMKPEDSTDKKKVRWEMQKRAVSKQVYTNLMRKALGTPEVDDDRRLESFDHDDLIYNDSVTSDSYDEAMDEMVFHR